MPDKNTILDLEETSFTVLKDYARWPANVRVGASGKIAQRKYQYERDGLEGVNEGTMYHASVSNAKKAEQRLLDISQRYGVAHLNKQWKSNYQEIPASVYVIVAEIDLEAQISSEQSSITYHHVPSGPKPDRTCSQWLIIAGIITFFGFCFLFFMIFFMS
ncbi:hypothetical protein M9434_002767 [Picochlorum sp. BPE23]|nr:hypothetical protein M9434_002767 [Picochlorum sp. BPE23]